MDAADLEEGGVTLDGTVDAIEAEPERNARRICLGPWGLSISESAGTLRCD